jgi:hypothetical protein
MLRTAFWTFAFGTAFGLAIPYLLPHIHWH